MVSSRAGPVESRAGSEIVLREDGVRSYICAVIGGGGWQATTELILCRSLLQLHSRGGSRNI